MKLTVKTTALTAALSLLTLPLTAAAQTTSLVTSVQAALKNGASVRTAQANLDKAQSTLAATKADPTALVGDTLQAQQNAGLASVQLKNARIGTLKDVISAYNALYVAQRNVDLQSLQVQSDTKDLQVVQIKLNVKNATALDLKNAQNALNASTQGLADARAQVSIAAQRLAALTGQSSGVRASGIAQAPALKTSQASLVSGLNSRLASVVQAQQAVDLAALNVKLYNNDFTPAQTLSTAKVTLANAQRSLDTATKNASTTLSSAYQAASNALELLSVAQQKEANARTSYAQDQLRLKSGVISSVDLLKSQLTLANAEQNRLQAQATALNNLAALSEASGVNLTGIGGI